MKGVFERFKLKVGESKELGHAKISAYEFLKKNDPLYNLRQMRDGNSMMIMEEGKYIRLIADKTLQMSDTRMEKRSNTEFVYSAKGRVFIAGLGIGLVLHNLADKCKSGTITEIVVMEKYQEVIDLISPYYKDLPITYILGDILKYVPPKTEKFDTIYFDIWATIDTDNLPEIAMLHNRWKFRKNKHAWMGSWMRDTLKRLKREENNQKHYW